MKELLIYRHAKTEKSGGGKPDFERELLPRGARQCQEMAQRLKRHGLLPDLVISSTAVRALQTAETTLAAVPLPLKSLEAPELYGSDAEDYLRVISERGGEAGRIVLIGHNPACEDLLELLTREQVHLRTAAVAHIRLPLDGWEELSSSDGGTLETLLEAQAQ